MNLEKKETLSMEGKIATIENELEKLCIQIINILKEHRRKGLINEEEYEEHTKQKERFLTYLNDKRQK